MDSTVVDEHYAKLLSPIYVWMMGGLDRALEDGEADLRSLLPGRGLAIDLGAGFGMHSIPLARAGWEVMAIDKSEFLLAQLASFGAGLPIETVRADLLDFVAQLHGRRPDLILCLGDTLTHVTSHAEVEALLSAVGSVLTADGRAVFSFRDYSQPPTGRSRFVSVRSDADRVLTCFLETDRERMIVHDILHERTLEGWSMQVSAYPKLRIAPEFVADTLRRTGLRVSTDMGRGNLVWLKAER